MTGKFVEMTRDGDSIIAIDTYVVKKHRFSHTSRLLGTTFTCDSYLVLNENGQDYDTSLHNWKSTANRTDWKSLPLYLESFFSKIENPFEYWSNTREQL